MKCITVNEFLEEYISGELEANTSEDIKKHIESCEVCKSEFEELSECINAVKDVYRNIEVSEGIGSIEKLLPQKGNSKKGSNRKIILVAAIFLLIFSISFSPIMARVIENIPMLAKYFTFSDKGIINSLENGFGQPLGISDKKKGIEFTVHNIIADENRTVILFSIKLEQDLGLDYGQISNLFIKNQFGTEIPISGYSYSYIKSENMLAGNIQTEKLGLLDKNLTLGFKQLKLTKEEETELNINLETTLESKTIDLGIEGVESIVIDSIKRLGETIQIQYEVKFKNESYEFIQPTIKLVDSNGTEFMGGRYSSIMQQGSGFQETVSYNLINQDINDMIPVIQYNSLSKNISASWSVKVNVEKDIAKNSTIEKVINKEVEIDGMKMVVERIVATPSETKLYFKTATSSNSMSGIGLYTDSFKLMVAGIEYKIIGASMNSIGNGEYLENVYEFEPIYDGFEDIKLILEKEKTIIEIDSKLVLTDINNIEKNTNLKMDTLDFDISYKKEGNNLIVALDTKDQYFRMINEVYILHGEDKQLVENIQIQKTGYQGTKGNGNEITFMDYPYEDAEIHFTSYTLLKDNYREIQLIP